MPVTSRLYEPTVGAVSAMYAFACAFSPPMNWYAVSRQAEAARVVRGVALEHVLAVLPQAHVEVAAVAGEVAERLRHERRDHPALLGERLDHVAEEDRAVGRGERVGEVEVLLELAVRVLVVGGVVVPAEVGEVARHLRDEVEVAGEAAHVVAGLVEAVERVRQLDPAVLGLAHEEVLELGADHELVAELARAVELVAQDRARAVGPLLALHVNVAGEPRHAGLPRQRGEAAHVRHGREVRVVRELADRAGGEPGEAGAVLHQAVEQCARERAWRSASRACPRTARTGTRCRSLDVALDVLARGRRCEGLGHAHVRKLSAFARRANVENSHTDQPNCSLILHGTGGGPYLHSVALGGSQCVESQDYSRSRST